MGVFYTGLLRGTARYYGDNELGGRVVVFAVLALIVLLLFSFVWVNLLIAGIRDDNGAVPFFVCVSVVLLPILNIWLITLVSRVRGLIE